MTRKTLQKTGREAQKDLKQSTTVAVAKQVMLESECRIAVMATTKAKGVLYFD